MDAPQARDLMTAEVVLTEHGPGVNGVHDRTEPILLLDQVML